MRLSLWSLALIFLASLFTTAASAQSDPRFAEAIEALGNWDLDEAESILKAACEEKVVGACGRLLSLQIDGAERAERLTLTSQLCETGDAYACHLLGKTAYWDDDKALARASYGAACTAGLPIACISHGEMLMNGEGGGNDKAGALAIYKQVCLKKYALACFKAADAIASSLWNDEREDAITTKMLVEVRALYKKACDNSYAEACLNLAKMLKDGEGGDRDPVRAMQLMEEACNTEASACEEVISLRFHQP